MDGPKGFSPFPACSVTIENIAEIQVLNMPCPQLMAQKSGRKCPHTHTIIKSSLIHRFLSKGQNWKKLSARSPRKLLVLRHSCSPIFKCQTVCQKNSKTSIANFWQVWIFWHISFSLLSSWRLDWCCNWWLFTNFRWQSNFCPFKGRGSN